MKKLISVFLALALCFSIFSAPASAAAEAEDDAITGKTGDGSVSSPIRTENRPLSCSLSC